MNNLGHTLYGKVLGIIGMGNIGKALARRAIASGMSILYQNRHRMDADTESRYKATYVTREDLLTQADFISLNLPYTPDTHHIINAQSFSMMKHSAYLINTARGAHVDEKALIEALHNKQIAGAALDVYEYEPNIYAELLSLDQVVLSPHIGTGTMEGRLDMCENVVDNILAFECGDYQNMNIVLEGKRY
jgi:lactate dehydrogenase-like 2-hydroxyacid dehydrogenase